MKHLLFSAPGGRFSKYDLFRLFVPILLEQALTTLLNLPDAAVASQWGDEAAAAVGNVVIIDTMIRQLLLGLAVGGSVLTAQYAGSADRERCVESIRCSMLCVIAVSVICTLVPLFDPRAVLTLAFGRLSDHVLQYAVAYFRFSVLSYPLFGAISVLSASLRAQADARTPMLCSMILMLGSLGLKLFFAESGLFGVAGCSLATLLAAMVSCAALLVCMRKGRRSLPLRLSAMPAGAMLWDSLRLAVPAAAENCLFQLGLVVLQRFIVSYGTVATAANGIARELSALSFLPSESWGAALFIVVGHCCGAADRQQARAYTRCILRLSYAMTFAASVLTFLFSDWLVSCFGLSPDTQTQAARLLRLYCVFAVFLHPLAFALPYALRGAGDTMSPMAFSLLSMYFVRILLAFVLGTGFGLRAYGVWLAMGIDWLVRALFFVIRYRRAFRQRASAR